MDIKELGFTHEELQDRVIERICEKVLKEQAFYDGEEYLNDSPFGKKLKEFVKQYVDEKINSIATNHILPNVSGYIENLTLAETNRWGEKKGEPYTFIEYLVSRAEHYMTERVDFEGKSQKEKSSYSSWNGTQTRLAHMVNKHLHYSIESAMKNAIKNANDVIVNGIAETVKLKLREVADSLKMSVNIKR